MNEQLSRDYTESVIDEWMRLDDRLDYLEFAVGIRLLRFGRLIEKTIDGVATEHGLIVSGDYEVLSSLRRAHPDPLQPAALADRAMITASGMTGRLDRLEGYGLVERRPHPSDRRGVDVRLTERGREITDEVFAATVSALRDMMRHLPQPEIRTLSGLLRSLLAELGDTPPQDD